MAYNLIGITFGDLTVIEKLPDRDEKGKTRWKCKCLCGDFKVTITNALTCRFKGIKSCGKCEWHIKHAEAYISWMAMKQRCKDPARKDYKYYGGRGISYDSRWEKFTEFYRDMGDPPFDPITTERLTLDRIDVNGDYTKNNCKWSTRSEQQLNKQKVSRED